jgi:hypothetical protein
VKTSIAHVAMDTHKKQHQVAWVHPETGEIQECYEVACTEGHRERTYENTLKKTC